MQLVYHDVDEGSGNLASMMTSASVNQVSQVAEEHLPEGVKRSCSCLCNGVTRVVQMGQINALVKMLSLKISSSQMAILLSMVAIVRLS